MEAKLQMLLLLGCLTTLVFIINMIRKEKLELKYSLLWIFICISIIFLCVFPNSINAMANLMGIITPINALFFWGLVSSLIINFQLTVAESRKSKKIKELSQAIALLEKKIECNGNQNKQR
ncbi:DUF2304 domain-containing protein [Paenibacillus profundus]|uniref:DUF2304 domain-containing protein n=1 Tax=Paenibacillus profundus TaxID=1173085 RepID=A0ABS8YG99_9BACL|nr:DUF2304 domain-containing protein [Paenibacillus profundus]MCE5169386.1 DUF2304 domain-containing protein [Paenibacillus profundus]